MSVDFSDVINSMRPVADGHAVVIPQDWLQGRSAFGGIQMAVAVRAMRLCMDPAARALPLKTAHVTFVGPVPGEIDITARSTVLRTGRSTCHARCDLMTPDAAVACSAIGIFGQGRTSQIVKEMPRPAPPRGPETCAETTRENFPSPAFLDHLEMRWCLGEPPYSGYAEPRSLIYVRLKDQRCDPELALVALSDSIPTPALSMLKQFARASSLNWMLEVLRDPAQMDIRDWVLIDTDVRAGTDGYLSQTSVLYGADGHAYSVSHQTVGVFA